MLQLITLSKWQTTFSSMSSARLAGNTWLLISSFFCWPEPSIGLYFVRNVVCIQISKVVIDWSPKVVFSHSEVLRMSSTILLRLLKPTNSVALAIGWYLSEYIMVIFYL